MDDKKPAADLGRFALGLFMTAAGVYLFGNQVRVTTGFWGWGYAFWGVQVTAFGMTLIPFMIGVAIIFFDTRSKLGWAIAIASLIAIIVGIIASLQVRFAPTTLYVALGILVLVAGGLGLMVRALKPY